MRADRQRNLEKLAAVFLLWPKLQKDSAKNLAVITGMSRTTAHTLRNEAKQLANSGAPIPLHDDIDFNIGDLYTGHPGGATKDLILSRSQALTNLGLILPDEPESHPSPEPNDVSAESEPPVTNDPNDPNERTPDDVSDVVTEDVVPPDTEDHDVRNGNVFDVPSSDLSKLLDMTALNKLMASAKRAAELEQKLAQASDELAVSKAERSNLRKQLEQAEAEARTAIQNARLGGPAPAQASDSDQDAGEHIHSGSRPPTLREQVEAFKNAHQRQPSKTYLRTPVDKIIDLAIKNNRVLCLTGPAGCGKTTPIEQAFAKHFGAYVTISMEDGVNSSALIGRVRVMAGQTYFEAGVLLLAMLADIPVVIDELSHCKDEAVQSILHPVLTHREVEVPMLCQTIYATGTNFRIFLTDNLIGDSSGMYGGFVGTACEDRLDVLKVTYPSPAKESKILVKHTGIDPQDANQIAAMFAHLRKQDDLQSKPFTMRQAMRLAAWFVACTEDGQDRDKAWQTALQLAVLDRRTEDDAQRIASDAQRYLATNSEIFTFEQQQDGAAQVVPIPSWTANAAWAEWRFGGKIVRAYVMTPGNAPTSCVPEWVTFCPLNCQIPKIDLSDMDERRRFEHAIVAHTSGDVFVVTPAISPDQDPDVLSIGTLDNFGTPPENSSGI